MPKRFAGYSKMMRSGPEGTKAPHISIDDDMKYTNHQSNLPPDKIMENYPKGSYGIDSYYNDNMHGIDSFAKQNDKQLKKQMNNPYKGNPHSY